MKAYNLEVWDRDFKIVDHGEITQPRYSIDYLAYGKNNMERSVTEASYGDYVRITGGSNEIYSGIINSIAGDNNKKKISYVDWMQLLDVDIYVDPSLLSTNTLENFIAYYISETYINNSDSSQNIPGMVVEILSATQDAELEFENRICNFYDAVVVPAIKKYGVVVSFELNVDRKEIRVKIGKCILGRKTIEADLPNCYVKNFVIKKTKKTVNKVIIYNEDDMTEKVEYYRTSDGEITDVDKNRIIPVEFQISTAKASGEITFAEAAGEKANNLLERAEYENLIELEFELEDELVKPMEMRIGQEAIIIHDNVQYSTYLTAIKMSDKITLIFGNIREELTKILKGRG